MCIRDSICALSFNGRGDTVVTGGDTVVTGGDGWWRVVTGGDGVVTPPKTPLLLSCAVIRQRACGHPLGGKTIGVGQ